MITVTVMYPNTEGGTFDMDYYVSKHFEIVRKYCADAIESITVSTGVGGGAPGAPAPYKVMATLQLKSMEAFQAGMTKGGAEIMGDIKNFTNITPQMQVSEVRSV
jgi:uncharacterized protein (TIGR02118 family)